MSLSLYDISIPIFKKHLTTISGLLKKAESYADEQGIPHSKFLEARLAPDMEPFTFQMRAVTGFAMQPATKLGGVDPIDLPKELPGFEECHQRIQKTLEILEQADKEKLDAGGEVDVTVQNPFGEFQFKGNSFVLNYVLPNFYFHFNMVYGLLRHCGVPIGKRDYFGFQKP